MKKIETVIKCLSWGVTIAVIFPVVCLFYQLRPIGPAPSVTEVPVSGVYYCEELDTTLSFSRDEIIMGGADGKIEPISILNSTIVSSGILDGMDFCWITDEDTLIISNQEKEYLFVEIG